MSFWADAHRIVARNNRFSGSTTHYEFLDGATDIYIDEPSVNGEQAVNPTNSTYTLNFDTPFTHYPRIDLTADAAVDSYSNWQTDTSGNYTGVDVVFGTTPNNVSWEAIPRNVGI